MTLFRYPMPDENELNNYYGNKKFIGSKRRLLNRLKKSKEQAKHLNQLFARYNIDKDDIILDLGAGIGCLVYELEKLGYKNVIGVEMRQKAIDFSREKLNITLIKSDIENALKQYPDVKVILLSHVLEHLPDPSLILKLIKTNCINAYLWFEVPDAEFDVVIEKQEGKVFWRLWLQEHLWGYTQKGLLDYLQKFKVSVIHSEKNCYYKHKKRFYTYTLNFALQIFNIANSWSKGNKINFRATLDLFKRISFFLVYKIYIFLDDKLRIIKYPDIPYNIRIFSKIGDEN
jgi:SAM-dependent methyltransferase